jgi:hypothetical protein
VNAAVPSVDFLRPGTPAEAANVGLPALWNAIFARLDADDRADLGNLHVGRTGDEPGAFAWTQTNADEDRVNLTLELKTDQLELNIVGWKEAQAEQLKDWLQTVRGETVVSSLPAYEVIAFARHAYKKTPTSKPWWQDETIELLGSCPAASFDARFITKMMIGLGSRKEVKPSFHVRRAWARTPVPEGDALLAALTAEVQRLLPVLRAIWERAGTL